MVSQRLHCMILQLVAAAVATTKRHVEASGLHKHHAPGTQAQELEMEGFCSRVKWSMTLFLSGVYRHMISSDQLQWSIHNCVHACASMHAHGQSRT